MTTIWLIRHAESALGAEGRSAGQTDTPLSAFGQQQAVALAARLSNEPLAAIFSSPQQRAFDTAAAVAAIHEMPVRRLDDLREMHQGEVDGIPLSELSQRYPDMMQRWREDPTHVRLPGGESLNDVQARVLPLIETLYTDFPNETIAVVGHAFVNGVLLCGMLDLSLKSVRRFRFDPAGVTRLEGSLPSPRMTLFNETQFLPASP